MVERGRATGTRRRTTTSLNQSEKLTYCDYFSRFRNYLIQINFNELTIVITEESRSYMHDDRV
jgi:hypothetical protein